MTIDIPRQGRVRAEPGTMGSIQISLRRWLLLLAAVSLTLLLRVASAADSTTITATITSATNLVISSSTSDSEVVGMPTLSSMTSIDTSVPKYPAPTVPPTENAPFVHQSTLPDGTVFIAVGAILGTFALAILAWRAIVACLLHRSVERAALAQHVATDKTAASFPAPPSLFYKYLDRIDSDQSLGGTAAAATGRGVRRTNRNQSTPSGTPSQTNLFFSPTAPGSAQPVGLGTPGNRDSSRQSTHLPASFYAGVAPSNLGTPISGAGHGTSISLSNLRSVSIVTANQGQGLSPPDSPYVGPVRSSTRNFSTSSINFNKFNRPSSQRTPSALLNNLLDERPGFFHPAGRQIGSGSRHHRRSRSQPRK